MLVSKNSANKPARKTSCSILPEKDRLKWLHHKMTPVWNYEAKAMFLTRGEACRCTSEVGLLLVCCIVWALTVTKPIQWPRTAAACWGLTSQVMLTSLNEKKLKIFYHQVELHYTVSWHVVHHLAVGKSPQLYQGIDQRHRNELWPSSGLQTHWTAPKNNKKQLFITTWFKIRIEFPNHTGCKVEFISILFQVYQIMKECRLFNIIEGLMVLDST